MEPSSNNPQLADRCRRLENQITTLKQISSLRKNLLELREKQAKGLISKLKFYEVIVTEERESRHSLSSRLQNAELQCSQLTERLAQNVHTIEEMKTNYENKVTTLINELQTSEQRNQQLSEQLSKECTIEELAKRLEEKDKLLGEMQRQVRKVWERNKVLSYQMSLLNNLFNETEGVTIDFEKIKAIGDIVRESQSFAEESDDVMSDDQDAEMRQTMDIENLLDSMEKSEDVIPAEIPGEESCYKSVDTKKGPELVLSVSRTFIKLKDLIVEKKSLQKEIDTLKALNTKLESKVDKQEHRLYRVTLELNKTWSLVSKLKQQHKKLYNSEAVLRYELQEKRALLEKLKNELSLSRDKWKRVRQKNSQSQIEWEKLRDEFAERKHQSSQESGTFSEVMSVSSGENDVTVEDVAEKRAEDAAPTSSGSRRGSNKLERSRKLSTSSDAQAEAVTTPNKPPPESEQEGEDEEDDFGGGAHALGPLEDEPFDDPLDELVSDLVADIENEADTEEDANGHCSSSSMSTSSRAPVENDSSPSPDFEDRMKRRAKEQRLLMLENQCRLLHQKLHARTALSDALSTKLASLHDHYGPSDSSTGTPSDAHHQQQQHDDTSNVRNEEATEMNPPASSSITVTDEETTSISTDTAYASGTENNASSKTSGKDEEEAPPKFDTQPKSLLPAAENATNSNCSSSPCQESSTSTTAELINESENNPICKEAQQTKDGPNSIANNEAQQQQSSQGQSSQDNNETSGDKACSPETTTSTATVCSSTSSNGGGNAECRQSDLCMKPTSASTLTTATNITLPLDQPVLLQCSSSQERSHPENGTSSLLGHNEPFVADSNSNGMILSPLPQQQHPPQLPVMNAEIQPVLEPHIAEVTPPVEEDPLPIIQETVVQHFPNTAEEEANEFAPVQIRPEFLRILQEADEATNANSLDWMPSLLTITHSVALLRLPELPSASSSGGRTNSSTTSELRIEIPSPPPQPIRQNDSRRMNHNGRSVHNEHHVSAGEDGGGGGEDTERSSAPVRKDPGFLSRMIIQQLPKRLQLLKNENHTLQMEAAESDMRMKEMKRQLNKELDKQQQLSLSLDAQIEDKNLIEFELREEIEKKEKVIEELQMEIDESKIYIDELKKEKDESDAYFKTLFDEKFDMEQPKVSPDSVTDCHNCKRPFTFITRRKCHCNICGKVYCKDCAIPREPSRRSLKRPRLCTRCHLRRQRLVALVNASKRQTSEENS